MVQRAVSRLHAGVPVSLERGALASRCQFLGEQAGELGETRCKIADARLRLPRPADENRPSGAGHRQRPGG